MVKLATIDQMECRFLAYDLEKSPIIFTNSKAPAKRRRAGVLMTAPWAIAYFGLCLYKYKMGSLISWPTFGWLVGLVFFIGFIYMNYFVEINLLHQLIIDHEGIREVGGPHPAHYPWREVRGARLFSKRTGSDGPLYYYIRILKDEGGSSHILTEMSNATWDKDSSDGFVTDYRNLIYCDFDENLADIVKVIDAGVAKWSGNGEVTGGMSGAALP